MTEVKMDRSEKRVYELLEKNVTDPELQAVMRALASQASELYLANRGITELTKKLGQCESKIDDLRKELSERCPYPDSRNR